MFAKTMNHYKSHTVGVLRWSFYQKQEHLLKTSMTDNCIFSVQISTFVCITSPPLSVSLSKSLLFSIFSLSNVARLVFSFHAWPLITILNISPSDKSHFKKNWKIKNYNLRNKSRHSHNCSTNQVWETDDEVTVYILFLKN